MFKFLRIDEHDNLIDTDAGYINGYHFGDRLLENCMFRININVSGKLEATVGLSCVEYFEKLMNS